MFDFLICFLLVPVALHVLSETLCHFMQHLMGKSNEKTWHLKIYAAP